MLGLIGLLSRRANGTASANRTMPALLNPARRKSSRSPGWQWVDEWRVSRRGGYCALLRRPWSCSNVTRASQAACGVCRGTRWSRGCVQEGIGSPSI